MVVGQNCSNLLITEINFWNELNSGSSGSIDDAYQVSHSIELFNPTRDPINLERYALKLYSEGKRPSSEYVLVELTGVIPPAETFVVVNTNASEALLQISDLQDTLLNYDGKVLIELVMGGEVIDRLGALGVSSDVNSLDIYLLLNDPNYLNSIVINFGSFEHLTLRRRKLVDGGNPQPTNEDLVSEWSFKPGFDTSDLGHYANLCVATVLSWQGFDPMPFAWEATRSESDSDPVFGSVLISGNEPSEDISYYLSDALHNFGSFPQAFEFTDYFKDFDVDEDFVIPAGSSGSFSHQLVTAIDNSIVGEPDRGAMVLFNLINQSPSVEVEEEGDEFHFLIRENDFTSTENLLNAGTFDVYPSIVSEKFFIEVKQSGLHISQIVLYSSDLKLLRNVEGVHYKSKVEVNVADIAYSGMIYLYLYTNKGHILLKIIKN